MAGKTNISDYRYSIFINNDQAKRSLVEMEKTMMGYEAELKKLQVEGKSNTTEYQQRKEAITKLNTEMVAMRKEAGLQALSLKELKSLQAQLRNELARAIPGSEHRLKLEKEFAAVGARVNEVTVGAKKTGSTFGSMAEGFNKYAAMATAVVASLTGLIFSFRKVIDTFNEYEKKLDNLSALTGLTGENLTWLSDTAKEMSTSVIEGNVRITQSADAIVDAYTKVGSARPELLKNKEDLNMVTQEAIILSEAANTELQPAVSALTGVLNQFNAPASDSRRIINALAAGSKEGAGEIPYLTEAIEKSGTVAADAGMSIEELVGTLETMAPRMTQPEMAGRSLRAVILKLQEGAKETNPTMVGFSTAIENLGKKNLSVTEMVKMFGIENITAAKILVNNVGELKKYTAAVTGTTVALEQASINTDNNASKLAQAQNRVQLLSIELGEKLAPALTFSTNGFSYLMKAILGTISFINEHRAAILLAVAALAAHTLYVYGSIAAVKAYQAVMWLAKVAQDAFNYALKSNPIGWVIAGITALVTVVELYLKFNSSAIALEKVKASTTMLLADANTKLKESYEKIGKQMQDLALLSAEEKKNLQDTIDLKIKSAEADLLVAEARQAAIGKAAAKPTLWQKIGGSLSMRWQSANDHVFSYMNQKEAEAPFEDGIQGLKDGIAKLKGEKQELVNIINAEAVGDKIIGGLAPQLEAKLESYKTALKNYAAGTEDYIRIQGKIKKTNEELQKYSENDVAPGKIEKLKTEYEKLNDQINELMALLQEEITHDPAQAKIIADKITRIKNYKEALDATTKSILEQSEAESGNGLTKVDSRQFDTTNGFYKKDKPPTSIPSLPGEDPSVEDGIQKYAGKANAFISDYVNPVMDGVMQIDQLMSDKENAQLARDARVNDEKKKNLQRQLNAKLISQKQYDAGVAKLDLEMENKKRAVQIQQAKRQKTISLTQAIINTALSVTSALSMQPFIVGVIMAVLAAALGAVQISTIAGTSVSEAAKGRYGAIARSRQAATGRYDVLGQEDNKQYRGVPFIDSPQSGVYGTPTLFAETGREIILNPKHTENLMRFHPGLIDAIMSVPQRASGAYPYSAQSSAAGPVVVQFHPDTLKAMNDFQETIKNPITANIVYDNLRDSMKTVATLEKNVTR